MKKRKTTIMSENKHNQNPEEKDLKKEMKAEEKAAKKAPGDLQNKVEELEKALKEAEEAKEELSKKVEDEKNDYLRLMAEFETFRRRTAKEKMDMVSSASAETIKGLLPVLDDCERALEILAGSSDEAAKEGTSLIYNKLMAYLKTKGLSVIEAKGKKFDTDFHEAVAQVPAQDEASKDIVFDVVTTGYMLGDKVLRFAKVVVGV